MGATLPAALGADWLVSTWDQNAGLRQAMPAVSVLEEVAGSWVLDLLGLPGAADVGFVTGATMANFTGIAVGRFTVLDRVGWDVHRDGLTGAPPVHVLVGPNDTTPSTFASALPRPCPLTHRAVSKPEPWSPPWRPCPQVSR